VHCDGAATFFGSEQSLEAGVIDKIGFNGSSAVGREIGGLTGRYLQTPAWSGLARIRSSLRRR
jgi:aldehyde dehydrogenase (NAD+)